MVCLHLFPFFFTYKRTANSDPRQRMINLRKLVLGLPKCNRDLLLTVIKFLNLVAEHEAANKMSSLNLAVV
jgi:RhoGAP domain